MKGREFCFRTHKVFSTPGDRSIIWRYMNLAKYLDLLHSRSLFFSKPTSFDDPFEGSVPKGHYEEILHSLLKAGIDKSKIDEQLLRHFKGLGKPLREHAAVSCWHAATSESAALWKLYGGVEGGVAVKSTVGRLKRSFGPDKAGVHVEPIYIGRVKYIDYCKASIPKGNALLFLLHKRLSFRSEGEVRAVIAPPAAFLREEDRSALPPQLAGRTIVGAGIRVPVDVGHLVMEVRVSPLAPGYLLEAVAGATRAADFRFRVQGSEMAVSPLF